MNETNLFIHSKMKFNYLFQRVILVFVDDEKVIYITDDCVCVCLFTLKLQQKIKWDGQCCVFGVNKVFCRFADKKIKVSKLKLNHFLS